MFIIFDPSSGFFWIDQLGLTANEGYWKVYRQDLVGFSGINGGSSYALAGPPGWVGGTHGGSDGHAGVNVTAEPGEGAHRVPTCAH